MYCVVHKVNDKVRLIVSVDDRRERERKEMISDKGVRGPSSCWKSIFFCSVMLRYDGLGTGSVGVHVYTVDRKSRSQLYFEDNF